MAGHVAVVGATGAVGQEFLRVLEQRNFPFEKITFMASARSAGKPITFKGKTHTVVELKEDSFKGVDIALFSAGGSTSKQFAPAAAAAGCVVVDNSSAFRMDPGVPLVVPEVNPEDIKQHKGIIANPNCSTIIMNVPVWPLHKVNPIKRIVVSTYQAVSGAGAWGLWELEEQIKAYVAGQPIVKNKFPHPIVNNLFCHNSKVAENGYNEEENKMVFETRKIFHAPTLLVTATCVRVPVPRAHSESINITFSKPITEQEVREILAGAPGVKIVDDRERNHFPMPLESSNQDDVLVGRIRQDISQPDGCGIEMFVSGDQLRKGAALNAVQIAELL
ncbi:MAG TPA: aspartate-semialdehyde dehydrogenase [Phycisphaerae bacterium]|nr:aspartate-semialdehyde dehydrogenase [Phycisphaerae bacterium]HOJ74872.1 aspartate-semialdehyde dehydrogenase [Phycisphaerae bacterium]HOM52035.1 aspartate-semialdehyde dehydrogenase [Phycisphaerae bacterium]HON64919.1 aspartate-semialdehyde dehydrogenase [Phycisphaerae bacterium]HPP27341.1 aspartate-semialdehyde dehydrogenase [Phycisphaerae bacterium]